jgi:hypothetical protein
VRWRGAIAVTVATAAVLLTVAPGSGAPGGGIAPADAADCVPVQHAKTVVKRKKVRRKGKVVKVKRRKVVRWTTCEPLPPAPSCAEPASTLGVIARDSTGSTFTLSRPCVSAGLVTVGLNNLGEDPHNLFLTPNGPGSEPVYRLPATEPFEVPSLDRDEGTFELSRGDWYLWCDLLSHEQQGMAATLQVR